MFFQGAASEAAARPHLRRDLTIQRLVFSEVPRAKLAAPLKKHYNKVRRRVGARRYNEGAVNYFTAPEKTNFYQPGRCAATVGRSVVQMYMKSFFLLQ